MLDRVLNCGSHFVLLQGDWLLQGHFDGRSNVEEEVMRTEKQSKGGDRPDRAANPCADDRVPAFCAEDGRGRRSAKRRRSDASWRERHRRFGLRLPDGVAD
jgi:hypothetical protein